MIRTEIFAAALVLDAIAGDPPALPHPVQTIGAAVRWCDRYAAAIGVREDRVAGRLAGVLTTASIVAGTYVTASLLVRATRGRTRAVEVIAAASTLAWRGLIDEVSAVERALSAGDLNLARSRVARIVGRDTHELSEAEVARAAIEALAESFCDGVVAPLCYLVLGGVPLAFAYKAINTLDSMIGHIESPYRYFGWCAARLDDVANVLPARLSALAITASAQLVIGTGMRSLTICARDARLHRSPNAGWPEAATAGALGVRLGGRNAYEGVVTETAVLAAEFSSPDAGDIRRAMRVVTCAALLVAGAALLILGVRDARA